MDFSIESILLYIGYTALIVVILAVGVSQVINLMLNPKKVIVAVIAIGGVAVLFLILYLISPGEILKGYQDFGVGDTKSKLIDSALYLMYLLGAGGILILIGSEVMNMIRK